jgi:hypothetical protein
MISLSFLNCFVRMSARRLDSLPIIITRRLPWASAGRRNVVSLVHSNSDSGTRASRCRQLMIYR